jgi:hypothetical protein
LTRPSAQEQARASGDRDPAVKANRNLGYLSLVPQQRVQAIDSLELSLI